MEKEICIMGAGGHAKVLVEIAELLGLKIVSIVAELNATKQLLGYPVAEKHVDCIDDRWIIGIGSNAVRKRIVDQYKRRYMSLIHPKSVISSRAIIGQGSVIMAGVVINSSVDVGRHCIVNTNASVDHDCVLQDFVHISPNAALAGNVVVGEGTHIGIGAAIIQGVKIGKWCVIGAGAVIIRDVPDGVTVVGNPGKILNK